jgi:hypothetical protein
MRLELTTDGQRWPIRAEPGRAPATLAALAAHLPLPVRFQTPKIAGTHLYWQAPFVVDREGDADVMAAPPGAFLFWPERQFLEIVFAPLQQETATVTMLGALENAADVAVVAAFGEDVRRRAGHEIVAGELRCSEDGVAAVRPAVEPALRRLREVRLGLWAERPAEIAALLADRGILHPAGPLHMAEAETRTLQELLWWWREHGDLEAMAPAVAVACDKAATRLAGLCHLEESAAPLVEAAAHLRAGEAPARAVVEEAILCLGALSAWLDLAIPWDDVNEAARRAHGG